jgi:hypothetical protein
MRQRGGWVLISPLFPNFIQNIKGELTQEIGDVIDWADPGWKDFYKVEK